MEKIKITKVYSNNKKKDGTPFKNNAWSIGLKTEQYGDEWVNGWADYDFKDMEGKEIEVEIFEKEYNGKTSKNFRFPKKDEKVVGLLNKVLNEITSLKLEIRGLGEKKTKEVNVPTPEGVDYPDEIDPEEIPF